MMSVVTGRERTLESFDELLRVSGWRLKETRDLVHLNPFKLIIAEPASLKPIALQSYKSTAAVEKPVLLTVDHGSPSKRIRRPISMRLRTGAHKVAEWTSELVPKVIKVDTDGRGSGDSSKMVVCAS